MESKKIWKKSMALALAFSTAFTGIPVYAQEAADGQQTAALPKAAYSWDFESVEGQDAGSGAVLTGAAAVVDGAGRDSKVLELTGNGPQTGYFSLPEGLFEGVGQDGFTLSMWVKPDEANGEYARIFEASGSEFGSHGDDWWAGKHTEIALAVGKGAWDTEIHAGLDQDGKLKKNVSTKILEEGSYLAQNEWSYLTVSMTPDAYKVYVNGSVITTKWDETTTAMTEALAELFADDFQKTLKYVGIGSSTYTGANDLLGQIDNVSFYQNALSAEEVKALYENDGVPATDGGDEEPPVTVTPVYSFDFEDGTAGAGTFEGKAEVTDDYNKGKVLQLSGGSMALPQDLFEKLGTEGFTISMWVKAASETGSYTKVFDASNAPLGGTNSGHNWTEPDFALAAGGEVYDMTLYIGEPSSACSINSKLKYDEHISRDKWQHMTVSVSPTDYKIYLDGREINYADAQGGTQKIKEVLPHLFENNYLASLKYASIGKSYYTSDKNFTGLVDDINFYDKALTAEETKALYESYGEIRNDAEPVTMSIDMNQTTGAVKHGATGFLYGIGEENVPDVNLMTAIKPYMCEQKPPEGLQHPNGDIIVMADTFLEAGGDSIQIACPDIYADWPYEIEQTADGKNDYEKYAEKLKVIAQQIKDAGLSEKAVYVIYNEPEGNWFGSIWSGNMDEFNNAWKLAYDAVKSVDPAARIAGPNFAVYHGSQLEKYMKFCAENDCIPYQMTWHVLGDEQYVTFHDDVAEFRSFEKKYWIDPGKTTGEMEIVINEYADFTQLGVPGQLARWIALFEDEKATACLAYWHISNNLCDLAASNNEPNGAWWLYKWYAEMSGETLKVTTEGAPHTKFYGVASLDKNKKSSMALFGGVDGSVPITLTNVRETGVFTDKVNVKIESTSWTGINGAAEEAFFVKEEICPVDENGNVVVTVDNMVAAAAYRLTITQADADAETGVVSEGAWRRAYEGEDAKLEGGASKAGTAWNYACSGTGQAQNLNSAAASATFEVEVPSDGWYRFDMVYGAATGNNTQNTAANDPKNAVQTLSVDGGAPTEMYLENTLYWYMSGQHTEYIRLTAGTHELKVAGTDSAGKATIDCMYLTYVGDDAALYQEQNVKTYEAELSDYNVLGSQTETKVTTASTIAGYSGAGYATGLDVSVKEGGGIRFTTFANENGMYDLKVKYSAKDDSVVNYYVNNTSLTLDKLADTKTAAATGNEWKEVTSTLFLKKGINIIDLDSDSAELAIDTLTVERAADQSETTVIEAEDCKTVGDVTIAENSVASNGKYVKEILADKDAKNALIVEYDAPVKGSYEFAVYQSNKELFGSHAYNAQMVDRFITISVNGGEPQNVYFRNTYSNDSFRSQVITLNLKRGTNTIKIYNSDYRLHKNGHNGVNVCTNYTPNLDKFEITRSVKNTIPSADDYADYTVLDQEIESVRNTLADIKESDYTKESYQAVSDALEAALALRDEDVLKDKQAKVDEALKNLKDAIAKLTKKPADQTALKTEIAKANALKEADYTPESYQAVKKALADLLALQNATIDQQDQVDKAVSALQAAMAKLVKKQPANNGDDQKTDDQKAVPKKGTTHTVGNGIYRVTKSAAKNGTVTYVKPAKKAARINVPATVQLNGYTFKVTAINSKAFYKNTKLKAVSIGKNVKTIGKNAFAGDKKLKNIIIKGNVLKKVGTKAFKGISSKAKITVPAKKYKAYKKLLKKAGVKSTAKYKKAK